MESFIATGSCVTRVKVSSEGEQTLVLLHGYRQSLDIWEEFAEQFTPHFKVVAIDMPGHGVSQVVAEGLTMELLADTVRGVLGKLGITKCLIVGHSMGGYVAAEFLRKYPELLSGLVMINSTPNADTEEKKQEREREIKIIESGRKALLADSVVASFAEENRERFADLIYDLADLITLMDDQGLVASLRGMALREDTNKVLMESDVPLLFVFGRGDERISIEVAEQVAEHHPRAQVLWLEHSGHMAFVEQAEEVAAAIKDFYKKSTI